MHGLWPNWHRLVWESTSMPDAHDHISELINIDPHAEPNACKGDFLNQRAWNPTWCLSWSQPHTHSTCSILPWSAPQCHFKRFFSHFEQQPPQSPAMTLGDLHEVEFHKVNVGLFSKPISEIKKSPVHFKRSFNDHSHTRRNLKIILTLSAYFKINLA